MTTLAIAIADAERALTGAMTYDGDLDPRWQAVIRVAEFIPDNAEQVWEFAAKWGGILDPDLQAAIATCLLEHLLEHHFDFVFPKVAERARRDSIFASTLRLCWKFGQAERPEGSAALDALISSLHGRHTGEESI